MVSISGSAVAQNFIPAVNMNHSCPPMDACTQWTDGYMFATDAFQNIVYSVGYIDNQLNDAADMYGILEVRVKIYPNGYNC